MAKKPNYHELVYDLTREIPLGRVSTYGAIADYLSLGSARMVGWALKNCTSNDIDVPAHRVVNRKGELSGRHHFPTPTMMMELLEEEGVTIIEDKVENFAKLLWIPSEHL